MFKSIKSIFILITISVSVGVAFSQNLETNVPTNKETPFIYIVSEKDNSLNAAISCKVQGDLCLINKTTAVTKNVFLKLKGFTTLHEFRTIPTTDGPYFVLIVSKLKT